MRIGLCGAHRTGKSTLAQLVAEKYGLELVSSQVSAVAKAHGFNMATDSRLTVSGFGYQEEVLASIVGSIEGKKNFISDRTPIDAAAYLLCDALASAGDEVMQEQALRYLDRARRETVANFDMVILVPPGISVEPAEGKPPVNRLYQENIHHACAGILLDTELFMFWDEIGRTTLSLDDRVAFVNDTINSFIDDDIELAA